MKEKEESQKELNKEHEQRAQIQKRELEFEQEKYENTKKDLKEIITQQKV